MFGQPRGLLALSGLEDWERFSFLGMQAILVLNFADTVSSGGMGMSAGTAASVSAAHGTLVCLVSVAGGRLADRILGSYRAVLWGGVLIACVHYAMVVPTAAFTWSGLGLISAGTGLLKPNVTTMVGKPHRTDDDRRDAGFALYYLAIDIGAFAGPPATGRLGDRRGRHWGFSAAAIGMPLGLAQYVVGRRHLAGRRHAAEFGHRRPHASNKIATGVVLGGLSFLLMVLPTSGHPSDDHLKLYDGVSKPARFGVNGAIAVAAGSAVPASAGRLRRTMHPVHRPDGGPAHAHPYVLPLRDDS